MSTDKEKHLLLNNTQLMKDWNWERNNGLDPAQVTLGSNKKAWWKCSKGHEWKASIKSRNTGTGCPYCSNNIILAGFNDLMTLNPTLALQWHPTKNGDIKPSEVAANSMKKYWWICAKGHEWEATIANRNRGSGCPVCCNKRVLVGFNDLATTNPQLASEWHPTKNGPLTPKDVVAYSHKKVWWKCRKGHEWKTSIDHRSNGRQCPKCSEELRTSFPEQAILFYFSQVTTAVNRYLVNPKTEIDIYLPEYRIGIEYDGIYYHKSKGAKQREVRKQDTLGSLGIILIRVKETDGDLGNNLQKRIIYSKPSPRDNELEKTIHILFSFINQMLCIALKTDISIARDRNAIYAQYITKEKEMSLLINNPRLAAEWHPQKNKMLRPEHVSVGSNKKIWWQCAQGHEWQATINSRNSGNGCPICSGRKLLVGYNDLVTLKPFLAAQWHPEKNGKLEPVDVTTSSDKIVWWVCEKGHEWEARVADRSKGSNCPICANRKILVGYNDLETTNAQLAKEWHPSKNGELRPTDVAANSFRRVWWQCSKGHEWESIIASRTRGNGCPICSGRKVLIGYNDLLTENPRLALQWHPTKNDNIKPTDVTANSKRKVWWECEKGHEWEATVGHRNKGENCPICANRKILVGYNDLATTNAQLAKEWHPAKNGKLLPNDVTAGSKKKVWWLCSNCGNEWESAVYYRNGGGGCPKCANRIEKRDQKNQRVTNS